MSIPIWTHSQNSVAAEEAPILKISFHGTSYMISNDHGFEFEKRVSGNWDSNIITIG